MVPVDYSEHSRNAVRTALEIAGYFGASIDLVHVWDRPSYVSDAMMVGHAGDKQRSLLELIRENAEKDMNEFIGTLNLPAGANVTHQLLSGEPAPALVKELAKSEHDLVVIGTHGRT